jgi:hypothetical protein
MLQCASFVLVFSSICADAFAQGAGTTGSDSPFALHVGAAYARVADTRFETVRALSGQDLFSQTTSRENTADFAMFVSQRLTPAASEAPRAYASLGTGLREPGATIYLGASVGFSRAFATAGVATRLVERGEAVVPDQIFRGTGDRVLFASLDRTREWGFFVAVSFGLIH